MILADNIHQDRLLGP